MTDVTELLTGVLAEHYDMDLTPTGSECECGQVIGSRFGDLDAQHLAHLAAVLAPVVARAQAEALRDAAEHLVAGSYLWDAKSWLLRRASTLLAKEDS